jgi:hypothetical protein
MDCSVKHFYHAYRQEDLMQLTSFALGWLAILHTMQDIIFSKTPLSINQLICDANLFSINLIMLKIEEKYDQILYFTSKFHIIMKLLIFLELNYVPIT